MKGRIFAAAAVLALVAGTAQGQVSSNCPATTVAETTTQDACQKAIDLFNYMAPQLGTVIAGGNPTLGQGGTLGGIGHFTVGIRGNAINGSLPNVEDHNPSATGAEVTNYEPKAQIMGLPAVDAAIGVFKGLPLGLTNVGGVDLLLSAWYLPEYSGEGIEVSPENGGLKIGYGARVGILEESLVVPGLSVTWMKRDLPVVSIAAQSGTSTLTVNRLDVQTTSWRIVASKSLIMFGLAAGYGRDSYGSGANVEASAGGFSSGQFAVGQDIERTSFFGNISMNLILLKAVAEIGQVSGGDITTYNQFGDKPADASRIYGSLGLRFGF